MTRVLIPLLAAWLVAAPLAAGEPEVVAAEAKGTRDALRIAATVRHDDEGWDHYADAWRVVGPDGTVYGERTLLHPHVTEQPFTRMLSGIAVPPGVRTVTIEAHDSVHGWGRAALELTLPD